MRPRAHKHTWQIFLSTDQYGVGEPVNGDDLLIFCFTALQLRLSVGLPSILTHIYTFSPLHVVVHDELHNTAEQQHMTWMCNTVVWNSDHKRQINVLYDFVTFGFWHCIYTQKHIITCKHILCNIRLCTAVYFHKQPKHWNIQLLVILNPFLQCRAKECFTLLLVRRQANSSAVNTMVERHRQCLSSSSPQIHLSSSVRQTVREGELVWH